MTSSWRNYYFYFSSEEDDGGSSSGGDFENSSVGGNKVLQKFSKKNQIFPGDRLDRLQAEWESFSRDPYGP